MRAAPRSSACRSGPPRNGGNPKPKMAPMSPSRGVRTIPSATARAASFSIMSTSRWMISAGRVHRGLLAPRVLVESLARLAPQPAALHHRGERRRRGEPLAEGGVHHAGHLLGDIHPDLVEQRDRPDGK